MECKVNFIQFVEVYFSGWVPQIKKLTIHSRLLHMTLFGSP